MEDSIVKVTADVAIYFLGKCQNALHPEPMISELFAFWKSCKGIKLDFIFIFIFGLDKKMFLKAMDFYVDIPFGFIEMLYTINGIFKQVCNYKRKFIIVYGNYFWHNYVKMDFNVKRAGFVHHIGKDSVDN